jgi:hypothetical protein
MPHKQGGKKLYKKCSNESLLFNNDIFIKKRKEKVKYTLLNFHIRQQANIATHTLPKKAVVWMEEVLGCISESVLFEQYSPS